MQMVDFDRKPNLPLGGIDDRVARASLSCAALICERYPLVLSVDVQRRVEPLYGLEIPLETKTSVTYFLSTGGKTLAIRKQPLPNILTFYDFIFVTPVVYTKAAQERG